MLTATCASVVVAVLSILLFNRPCIGPRADVHTCICACTPHSGLCLSASVKKGPASIQLSWDSAGRVQLGLEVQCSPRMEQDRKICLPGKNPPGPAIWYSGDSLLAPFLWSLENAAPPSSSYQLLGNLELKVENLTDVVPFASVASVGYHQSCWGDSSPRPLPSFSVRRRNSPRLSPSSDRCRSRSEHGSLFVFRVLRTSQSQFCWRGQSASINFRPLQPYPQDPRNMKVDVAFALMGNLSVLRTSYSFELSPYTKYSVRSTQYPALYRTGGGEACSSRYY